MKNKRPSIHSSAPQWKGFPFYDHKHPYRGHGPGFRSHHDPQDPNCAPPWVRHYWQSRKAWRASHPRPRHWMFLKVLALFVGLGLAIALVFCLAEGRFPAHFGWVLLVMFLGFVLLRRMFGPMRHLMHGVYEISNGNLDFQFPVSGRHGEIGFLAEHFNLMVRRVREMIQAKEQLLLDVSHELRSPLTRLKLALEMAPKGRWKTSMIRDVREMESMLSEILETARLKDEKGKLVLTQVPLNQILSEMVEAYRERTPGIRWAHRPGQVLLEADENRLRTVLRNVLENALKYSEHQKQPVELALAQNRSEVVVTVRDFGVGIPLEEQDQVFEPFYRVDKSRTQGTGGYGLGLSLCREIMRAHGGTISLHSEPGKGCVFSLRFPKDPKPLPPISL